MCILHVHQLTVQISTNGGLGNAYNDEQQNKSISTCLNHMKGSKENKNVVSDYQAWALPQYEDSCGRGFLFLSMFYNQSTLSAEYWKPNATFLYVACKKNIIVASR